MIINILSAKHSHGVWLVNMWTRTPVFSRQMKRSVVRSRSKTSLDSPRATRCNWPYKNLWGKRNFVFKQTKIRLSIITDGSNL